MKKGKIVGLMMLGVTVLSPSLAFADTSSSTLAPVVSSNANNITQQNYSQYTVSGTGTAGDFVKVTLTDSSGHQAFGTAIVASDSSWSAPVNLQTQHLLTGNIVITATQTDSNGQDSPVSSSVTVTNSHFGTVTPSVLPGGGGVETGVYVLNNRNAVDVSGAGLGHLATAVALSNGELYYCSFDSTGGPYAPGRFDQAPSTYAQNNWIFPSLSSFDAWLNSGTSGYSPSNLAFFATNSTEAQNAYNEVATLRANVPYYSLGTYDCQTVTDQVLSSAGFNVSYFTDVIPNSEMDNIEYIITNSGFSKMTLSNDTQWVYMYMYNPSYVTYTQ